MPKLAIPLTDIQVRNAKPRDKPYKLADGGGMYLEVMPTGSKFWRMSYRQSNGKGNRLTFGSYPETTLAEAREKRTAARRLLRDGIDPARHRDDAKRIATEKARIPSRKWRANGIKTRLLPGAPIPPKTRCGAWKPISSPRSGACRSMKSATRT